MTGGRDGQTLGPCLQRVPSAGRRGALDLRACPDVNRERVAALHSHLEEQLGTVDLVLTNNRHTMVSVREVSGRHQVRVQHLFAEADSETVAAIVAFALGDVASRSVLRAYIYRHRDLMPYIAPCPKASLGAFYDLDEILDGVREILAPRQLGEVAITWGRNVRGKQSIRFGSYHFERKLIRIHPALDQAGVPRYFLEFVVYHEALHALHPPASKAGRRVVHSPRFRAEERAHPRYEEAMTWEKENLERLLARRLS
jgi:hypothetical protein